MKSMRRIRSLATWCLLAATLLLATGCRGPWSKNWKYSDMLSPKKMTGWGNDELEPESPRRLVGTWTDTVLHQTGKNPQRGFGGRLIFYAEDAEKPVLVEGQLVIYAFDETNRELTNHKPTRRYVFPPDQVARRMSKTALGPSYSFWLPWDEAGGPQTEVSLIARFQPIDGAIVVGEQTKHLLPGELGPATGIANGEASKLPAGIPMRPATPTLASLYEQEQARQASNQVQLASYESPAEPASQTRQELPHSERRMTTTSISLPENFRLRGGGSPNTAAVGNVVQSGNAVQAGNVLAEPQAPPPVYGAVAAPISYPAVNTVQGISLPSQAVQPVVGQLPSGQQLQSAHPGFMTPQQSPLGNGFVAPLQPAILGTQQPVPQSVGQMGVPPTAPLMAGQPPLTTASGWPTANYPAGGQAAATAALPQSSSGYRPQTPLAPLTPTFR